MKHEQVNPNICDEYIIKSYKRTGNVWKTGAEVGLCGQTVHRRLTVLGFINKMNLWTKEDDKVLLEKYTQYRCENRLDELAKTLGRTKQFICRKAKALGLTNGKEYHRPEKTRIKLSDSAKKWIKERGHPKGFLGHTHTDESKRKMSEKSIAMWKNPDSLLNSEMYRQMRSDLLHERKMKESNSFSIRGHHRCDIDGKLYVFKSSWEKEVAIRLQDLKTNGLIKDWLYESKHFNFGDVKRGIRSYCPDFEVFLLGENKIYLEVKGWEMKDSMTRIKMFLERYPTIKFHLIDKHEYRKIISESDYLRRLCV